MKFKSVIKLDKKNTATATLKRKKDDDVMSENLMSLSFFQFMAKLEQPGSRIPDAWSVKLTFS